MSLNDEIDMEDIASMVAFGSLPEFHLAALGDPTIDSMTYGGFIA